MRKPDRTTGTTGHLHRTSDLDDHVIHIPVPSLEGKLAAGTTVLCDRYAFSGVAFSAAKGLPLAWFRAPDVGLPTPEVAAAQGGYGEERYETEVLQVRVRTVFKDLGVRHGVEYVES